MTSRNREVWTFEVNREDGKVMDVTIVAPLGERLTISADELVWGADQAVAKMGVHARV